MSWLFSQALVEEYLGEACLVGAQFALSSENLTPQAYLPPGRMTEFSRLSRFGMTFAAFEERSGAALLMWFQQVFLARTSQVPEPTAKTTENSSDLMAPKADCGKRQSALFAKWSQVEFCWKTRQTSLLEDSESCSVTWPRSGSMQDGRCYLEKPLALPMNENECGLWLPTPTAHNAKEGNYPAERTRNTPTLGAVLGGKINPRFQEWMMGFPQDHTDLRPGGMHKFQLWQQQHGGF